MTRRHFSSYTAARSNLRSLLDAAHAGQVTTLARDRERYAVVDAGILRDGLTRLLPSRAVVTAEGGGWSAVMPGLPVAGDGDTFDVAVDDLIDALRDYAEDWNERLLHAPNHRGNWVLVQLVELSTDDQLRSWLLGAPPQPAVPEPASA
ncbi:MAG: prevent-host-death protein [Actinomycetota bacterium]|nr:prevent-host-death protein [Actinomycetota bacterium]